MRRTSNDRTDREEPSPGSDIGRLYSGTLSCCLETAASHGCRGHVTVSAMVGGGQHARPERMLTGQTVFFQQCALPWVNQFKKMPTAVFMNNSSVCR